MRSDRCFLDHCLLEVPPSTCLAYTCLVTSAHTLAKKLGGGREHNARLSRSFSVHRCPANPVFLPRSHLYAYFLFYFLPSQETRFDWANDDNGTWALNTFLVFALLGVLIVCHILLVSYLEASWLSQVGGRGRKSVCCLLIVVFAVKGQGATTAAGARARVSSAKVFTRVCCFCSCPVGSGAREPRHSFLARGTSRLQRSRLCGTGGLVLLTDTTRTLCFVLCCVELYAHPRRTALPCPHVPPSEQANAIHRHRLDFMRRRTAQEVSAFPSCVALSVLPGRDFETLRGNVAERSIELVSKVRADPQALRNTQLVASRGSSVVGSSSLPACCS